MAGRIGRRVYSTRRCRQARAAVLERDDWTCQARVSPECLGPASEVDHVVPLHRGGAPFDHENLRSVCKACHRVLHSRKPTAWDRYIERMTDAYLKENPS